MVVVVVEKGTTLLVIVSMLAVLPGRTDVDWA